MFFWNKWSLAHRVSLGVGFLILLTVLAGFCTAWYLGLHNVVRWDVLSELSDIPATLARFTDGLFDFPIQGKAYIVTEQYVASAMEPNVLAARLAALGICLGLAFIHAAITRLNRWQYLVAFGLLIVQLATFRLEALALPGMLSTALGGRLPFVMLVLLFGAVSYYFHAFRTDAPLPLRLAVFLALILIIWVLVTRSSGVSVPALAFVSYAMPGLLLLTVGFLFLISTEIIAGLVYITSVARATSRPLGLNNFLVIAGLYLVNLLLVWLSNTKAIAWTPILVSPFVLYLVSLGLGFWGFRQQLKQSESGVSYRETGAFLYLGLGMLATITVAYAFASANDPMIEALEDSIIYIFFGMGVVFTAYIVVNFWMPFRQALPVYRVLYKPTRFSLFQTRLVAAIGILCLLSTQRFFPLTQAAAGHFNNLGDLHVATGEYRVAEQYYQLGVKTEFQNHKSNYALASLAMVQNDQVAAAGYYRQALLKQPSAQAFVGLSATYLQTNLFFEAVKALQQGLQVFPKNGELQNNLGYLYARTSVADSAYYYLAAAAGNVSRDDVPQTNLLSLWIRNPNLLSLDSLAGATDDRSYQSYRANRAALSLLRRPATDSLAPMPHPDWVDAPDDSAGLSAGKFAEAYNYALLNRKPDPSFLTRLKLVEQNPANQELVDDLMFARAVANYYTGDQKTAFELTTQLAQDNTRNGEAFQSVTGLWMMEQGLYRKAADVFELNTDTLSAYYRALAFTKAGDPVMAQPLWETAGQNDAGVRALADVLYNRKEPSNDIERAFALLYGQIPPEQAQALVSGIKDPNLRTIAAAGMSRRYAAGNQLPEAERWYEQIPEFANLNAYAGSLITVTYMRLQLLRGRSDQTMEAARQTVVPALQAEKDFLLGRAYETKKQAAQARQQYTASLRRAPFRAETTAAAAALERKLKQPEKAYNLVLNAMAVNEQNPDLQKLYIDLCLDLSLFEYAEDALPRLQGTSPPADYQAFLTHYQARRALIEKQRQTF
ncbi:tetratricopeptide repeat protein [Tellurirhabdus rosea]|uniref:tetratricopeptide repeat protein n=1 Tax=Tellurirhabdus rosea TaxID=2674997 RepID=UPI00225AA5FF|nr:hypothetical protein [Tellurirhabdus rosea]